MRCTNGRGPRRRVRSHDPAGPSRHRRVLGRDPEASQRSADRVGTSLDTWRGPLASRGTGPSWSCRRPVSLQLAYAPEWRIAHRGGSEAWLEKRFDERRRRS